MDQRLPKPTRTDWRGLCEELVRELQNAIAVHYGEGGTHHISAADAVIAKTDAALAQPEPEAVGPSDEELTQEWRRLMGAPEAVLAQPMLAYARAVLARFGHHPAPPAEGEAKLVKTLRELAYPVIVGSGCAVKLRRAADLLERQAAPVAVAASERLPDTSDPNA